MFRDDILSTTMNDISSKINTNGALGSIGGLLPATQSTMSDNHSSRTDMDATSGAEVVSMSIENSITTNSGGEIDNEDGLKPPHVDVVAEASDPLTSISLQHPNVVEDDNVYGEY